MKPSDDELFGSPDQTALMRRAQHLWTLLHDDPAFSYYGRMVSLVAPADRTTDLLAALATLQGATSCQYFPATEASRLCRDMEALGFSVSRHEQIRGGDEALAASKHILKKYPLPDDLTVEVIDDSTPRDRLAALAALSLSCDVLPVPGSVMRGLTRQGVCLLATDRDGNAVATASSYLSNHPSSPHGSDAFWGMLATRDDRRGQGIALTMGAQAIVNMNERFGVQAFTTCVNAENMSSIAVCKKAGITATDWVFIGCIDPKRFRHSLITK